MNLGGIPKNPAMKRQMNPKKLTKVIKKILVSAGGETGTPKKPAKKNLMILVVKKNKSQILVGMTTNSARKIPVNLGKIPKKLATKKLIPMMVKKNPKAVGGILGQVGVPVTPKLQTTPK